jgi:hypothetical protein
MKEKLIELSQLSRETAASSCTLDILKNGCFKVKFVQLSCKVDLPERRYPEEAIDDAIAHIMATRSLLAPGLDRTGMAPEVRYTMRKLQFA